MLKELPARNTDRVTLCSELTFAVRERTILKHLFCTELVQPSPPEPNPPAGRASLFTASISSQGSLVPGQEDTLFQGNEPLTPSSDYAKTRCSNEGG